MSDRQLTIEESQIANVHPSPDKVSPGYKRTEVRSTDEESAVPPGWQVKPLSSISLMYGRIGWQGLTQAEFTTNSEDPFLITGVDFKDADIDWEAAYHVPQERYDIAPQIQLRPCDVLMTKDGTIGKMLYVKDIPYPGMATLNSHLLVFRPINDAYVPLFLFYQMSSRRFLEHIEEHKSGSTFFGLSQTATGRFMALLPPIEEQRAIAAALSDVDGLIRALDALIEKKRAIKQATMQQLLTGKKRLPGFSGEWRATTLGETADIKNGATPSTQIPAYWNGQIPWCTPTDITGTPGKYLLTTERSITVEGLENCAASLLPVGALLLCSRATIGEIKIAASPVCTNQGFKSLVCKSGISNEFLYYLLLTLKPQMIERAIGSTFLEIGKPDVASIKLRTPEYSEQTAIAAVLSDMDAEIAALERRREKTEQIKQGMMQQLLTGRIRLVEPPGTAA